VTAAGADAEAIDNILGIATAFGSLSDVFDGNVLADGVEAYQDAMSGVNVQLDQQISAVADLAAEYDGTAAKATELANATNGLYQAATQAVAQITSLRASIAEMFSNAATNYRLAGMDNAGQREYLQGEITRDTTALEGATDAREIERLANEINQGQQALWALLSDEERRSSSESFAVAAEAAAQIADDKLQGILDGIESTIGDMIEDVRIVLTNAGKAQQDAADVIAKASATSADAANTQIVAANTQLAAARTTLTIDLRGVPTDVGAG
jgi:hypothetical protein